MPGIRVFAVLLISILTGGVDDRSDASGDRAVRSPMGDMRRTTVDDIRPNLDVKHEMWSYRFILDGGIQLFIDLRRADLGTFKGKVLGADFSVIGFNGDEYAVSREYPPRNLTFDERSERLSVHPSIWFEGQLPREHRVYYATRKEGISYFADLTFSQIAPGVSWGDGIYRFGDDELMGLTIPVPYARVHGKVAINSDTVQVSGTGYMDHVFQTDRVTDLVDGGYRVVSHDRGWEVGFFLQPTDKYDVSVAGYGAFNMGAGPALFRPIDMTVAVMGRVGKKDVPTRLVLADAKGRQRTLERSRNLQKLSLLREVSGIKRFIAKKIAGGDVTMFRGVGLIDGSRPMAYDYFIVD